MEIGAFIEVRKARGLTIAQTKKIEKLSDHLWVVPSQSNAGKYAVDPAKGTCLCPDYETNRLPCKHMYAVQFARHQLVAADGSSIVSETLSITYPQKWPAYRAAQMNEKSIVQRFLKDLCARVPQPQYKGNGRPSLSWSDVTYGICTTVYSGDSAFRAHSDVKEAATNGFIADVAHPNTILRYLAKPELTPILINLVETSAAPLKAVEENFAIDSTGFSTTSYVRYFDHKHGKDRRVKKWIKLHAAVGVKTNIMTAVRVTTDCEGDAPQMPGLVRTTAATFTNMKEVSGDKAYLSNENLAAIESFGATPYIPFRSNMTAEGGRGSSKDAWDRAWHRFNFEQERFLGHYHRRSNVESTFGAMKKVFGHAVRAKTNEQAQMNEVLVKCLLFNTHVLVHEMFELGIDVNFAEPGR